MATFNIKRGDSMPPLIISMRIAGTDPDGFYDFNKDEVGSGLAGSPSTVTNVNFILTKIDTKEIVNAQSSAPGTSNSKITGTGEIYEVTIADQFEDKAETIPKKKTLLKYNWRSPDDAYNANNPVDGVNGGDTAISGIYKAEFEIFYPGSGVGSVQPLKRTFPSTPGDTLIVNILPDDNDKQPSEVS